jgi:hypothetical protein
LSAEGYRFVRVETSALVKFYFLPVLPGIPASRTVTVTATAGQVVRTSLANGLAPFSPDAFDTDDPDFGFTPGVLYTLRWAPPGKRKKEGGSCPGDQDRDASSSSDRGYIDVGQDGGTPGLRQAIVNNTFSLINPIEVGTTLDPVTGQKSVTGAMEECFAQDTDTTAANYSVYQGNGRRLFTVAVNDGGDPARVVGFASFFLQPEPCGDSNTSPCCGEYVGSAVLSSRRKGAGPPGLYAVQLVQ